MAADPTEPFDFDGYDHVYWQLEALGHSFPESVGAAKRMVRADTVLSPDPFQ